jgi:hypothetical protein
MTETSLDKSAGARTQQIEYGTVYSLSSGRMVPIKAAGLLPVGQIVTYSDMANPRREFVVTGAAFGYIGQACTCEDGHTAEVSKNAVDGPGGWKLGNRILDAEEIAQFLAAAGGEKARIAAERETAKHAQATADQAAREQYTKEFTHLERAEGSKKSRHALAASNLRKVLARQFPGVKFSITSKSFSMGNSVDVRWTDGPTTEAVAEFADRFEYGTFDAMTDCSGIRHSVFMDMFGSSKYVHCSRDVSGPRYIQVAAEMGYHDATVDQWGCLQTSAALTYENAEMIKRETWKRAFPV